ncbi:hypothetical protein ONS95_008526 [Cadophora gregata]|uniref:uncharacterized protein n=1 Tax=Cadophora gregata TaxID=51156 RepID=UPI0026DD8179|nr:uncharacterized protein ONS95_008526 [Cadophora gregata]KAK0100188.1 hypothetical protein ONS95_008526 [Cadophora gregata]KAK0114865.1 hypothetical protein ONS96_013345 [Cadophora gregata f. sp. sojae]
MNSLANLTTTLYNHTEPILSLPSSGTCSLLTGIERAKITPNIFQPCCSDAAPVGFERSSCKAENGWETCFAQHREEFRLVAAVCSADGSSDGGRRMKLGKIEMGLGGVVVLLGVLAVQSGF